MIKQATVINRAEKRTMFLVHLTSRNSSMPLTGWNIMNSRKTYKVKADSTKGPGEKTRKDTQTNL